jgi:putative Ca2+/H+ antiporter (TMEM165/GDT1 family)
MEKIQKWANIIGVVSAVIALSSLAVTLGNIRSDSVKARINEWQEVAVFSIISDAKLEGVSFGDIQSQYKTKAADLPDELPRTEIQTQALKKVLLSTLEPKFVDILHYRC